MFNVNMFFFFSSRRRHTRYWRDWSSDVCSSDLSSIPIVALDTATPLLASEYLAISSSNLAVLGPDVIQPDFKVSITPSISNCDISGGENGIFFDIIKTSFQ